MAGLYRGSNFKSHPLNHVGALPLPDSKFSLPQLRPLSLRQTQLRFKDLNVDLMLEIFLYYVASQSDGAFILTLVSRPWRDFVLLSPALWQWITIDEQSPDRIELASLCYTLSGAYPLQIVLRLPITEWETLLPLLPRCQNLFFEIPNDMTARDVSQATEKLFRIFEARHNCEFHYYRAGEYLLKEAREPISVDLSRLLHLDVFAEGSEHQNYHKYTRTRDIRYLDYGDEYHPLILLKVYHLLEILRNASNLRILTISHHSMDPIFSELDLPLITLVDLDELQITGIDYIRNGSLLPFIQSIKCPNLSTLVLSGYYENIMDIACRVGEIGNPSNLEFRYGLHRNLRVPPSFQLPSVTRLRVHVDDKRDGMDWDITKPARSIEAAIHAAIHATVICLALPSSWCERGKNTVVECLRHGSHSRAKCEISCHDTAMLDVSVGGSLKEIDVKLISHAQSLTSSLAPVPPCNIGLRASFTSLTSLLCTPHVLLPLLSQHLVPTLNSIQLHLPQAQSISRIAISAELDYFDQKVTKWVIKHVECHHPLRVHIFGLSWFPNWRSLIPMIHSLSKSVTSMEVFTLKLPAYPHPSVQWELALAMGFVNDRRQRLTLPPRPSLLKWKDTTAQHKKSGIGRRGTGACSENEAGLCYYCRCSGISCKAPNLGDGFLLYCGCHSETDLVSFRRGIAVQVT